MNIILFKIISFVLIIDLMIYRYNVKYSCVNRPITLFLNMINIGYNKNSDLNVCKALKYRSHFWIASIDSDLSWNLKVCQITLHPVKIFVTILTKIMLFLNEKHSPYCAVGLWRRLLPPTRRWWPGTWGSRHKTSNPMNFWTLEYYHNTVHVWGPARKRGGI